MPGVIGSLILLIAGAIARYAYSDSVIRWTASDESHALRVDTIGSILIIAGLVALVLSVAYAFMREHTSIIEEESVIVDDAPDVLPPKKVVKKSNTKKS